MTDYDAKVATGGSRAWLRILLQTGATDEANNRVYARLAYEIDPNGAQTANSGYTSYWAFNSSLTGPKSGTFTYNLANGYVLLYDTGYQWWNCAADGTFHVTASGDITPDSPLTNASVSLNVTPVDFPRPPRQPNPPTLSRTSNGASITIVSQTPSSPVTVTDYNFVYSTDGANWSAAQGMGGYSSIVWSAPSATTQYYFETRAYSSEGWGAWSNYSSIAGVPSAPVGITTTRTARNVLVQTGTSTTDGGATANYFVQYSTDSGSSWSTGIGMTYNSSSTKWEYTYSNLTAGLTYVFRTYAANSTGSSAFTTAANLFVPAGGRRYNGTSWNSTTTAKRYNGSAWVDLTIAKRYNGTTWVDLS